MSDYFTFPVPEAKFMPSVRNKYWDGNIRLYAQTTGKLYLGLYYALEQFAKDRDYNIEGYGWETDMSIQTLLIIEYGISSQRLSSRCNIKRY